MMKKISILLSITLGVFLAFTTIAKAQQVAQLGDGSKEYTSMNAQTLESLEDYEVNPANMEFSKYGGWKGRRTTATGFFRVEKIDGRWWAIDPEGYYYFHKALNSVNTSGDYTVDQAHRVLDDNGFNGMGNWSNEETIESSLDKNKPLAYCPRYSFIAEYRRQRNPRIEMPVFDDEFEAFAKEGAKAFTKYINDPQVFGYFSDNELPWRGHGLPVHIEITDTSDKNYITANNFLRSRGKTKDNFDEDDEFAYMALMSERYYSIVSKAIKAVDPNHMFIGSRCNSVEKRVEGFMRNAGKYVDIFSNNHYSRWGARDFEINNMANWSGRPLMMTEFYTMEVTPGVPVTGAGFRSRDQVSRGIFYENFATTLAANKAVVGLHWFKFQDDGNGNKGVIDVDGNRYNTVLGHMKEVNTQIYNFIDYTDSKPTPDVTLIAEADASYRGNTNYNTDELRCKAGDFETYIRFDVSSLSSGISKAQIKLFSIGAGSDISNYQAALVTNDNWNERTINSSNSPNGSTVLRTWSAGDDITIDVTEELLDALGDNDKLSIRVISTRQDSETVFYASSEHADQTVRPQLMVFNAGSNTANGKIVHITKRNAPEFAIDGGLGGANKQNIALSASNTADAGQLWVEIDKGGGHFAYEKYGTNYSLGGGEGGARNQNVRLWNNADGQNQQWKKTAVGDGSYKLIKRNKNAFAVNGGSGGKEGQNISLWESASTSQNLQWYVRRLVHITKRNAPEFAIDGGNGGSNRQNVTLSAANTDDPGQIWVEIDRGNGYYSYEKYGTNFSLDAGNGGAINQSVYLWKTNAAHQNQQWQKVAIGDGSYKLIKRNASGFTINGGSGGVEGKDIDLWNSASTNQNLQWFITPITTIVRLETNDTSRSNKVFVEAGNTVSELKLYPNPVSSTTTILNAANSVITVYDMNGSIVLTTTILNDNEVLSLKNLSTGVYYAKITGESTSSTFKILKK